MQEESNQAPQINRGMLLVLILLIIAVIVYVALSLFGGTDLNIYERTATAIERNATISAENNGDIYAVTATRLVFQATASPGFLQTEVANRLTAEAATDAYWETQGVTPTPDEIELTNIALFDEITQTVDAQLAGGCQQKLLDARRLVIDYRSGLHAPQIRDSYLQNDFVVCPNDASSFPEWVDDDYILIVFFTEDSSEERLRTGLSLAIEKIVDYPLRADELSSGSVSLLIQNDNRQSFSYTDAIIALESGLREQDLLDALNVEIVR